MGFWHVGAVKLIVPWSIAALLLLGVAGCGSQVADSANESSVAVDTTSLMVVPDVTGEDGSSAQSDLESEGLTATFDPVDPSDPAGCTVVDQDPVGGTELDTEVDSTDVTLTVECPQLEWENQEGDAWDEFNQAYTAGWDSGCAIAFEGSPDGTLHEDGMDYTASDCEVNTPIDATNADTPVDVPDDPTADGTSLGEQDGCVSAFEDVSMTGTLNYGSQSFSAADCPTYMSPGSSGSSSSAPTPKQALSSTDYRVPKSVWDSYSSAKKKALSALFIENNPRDCRLAVGSTLPQYIKVAWRSPQHPRGSLANDVMLEFCMLSATGE